MHNATHYRQRNVEHQASLLAQQANMLAMQKTFVKGECKDPMEFKRLQQMYQNQFMAALGRRMKRLLGTNSHKPNGDKECARRRAQMAAGTATPNYVHGAQYAKHI